MTPAEWDWRNARITDEAIEALQAQRGRMGPLSRPSDPFTLPVIMRFCNGVGDDNPLWFDETYASRTRWGGIIAPPTVLHVRSAPHPDSVSQAEEREQDLLPGIFAMVTGGRTVFQRPVRPGDTLRTRSGLHDVIVRRSRMAGRSLEQVSETVYYNQRDEVVATHYGSLFRMERAAARDNRKVLDLEPARYTEDEMESLYACYEREHEQRRGDRARYWEDTGVGEELITLAKGPLTIGNMVAFFIGWGYATMFANRLEHLYLKGHPAERLVNAETNIEDGWVSAHWDEYFAHQSGVPRPYDEGIQRVTWLAQLLTDWMGDDGYLRELAVQLRAVNLLGDVSWCTGRVSGKRLEGERHLVDCDVWITNQRQERTALGTVVVELPARG